MLQVLNNLIINSIKSFDGVNNEKKIRLDCRLIDNNVELLICDTGCGIGDSIKNKIFEMYFSNTKGSGVGLYHARYILDSLYGSIELLESFDKFTTIFKIIFPVQTNDEIDINN